MAIQPMVGAFVGNDTWFAVVMVIHVIGAVIGLGPTFAFGILAAVGKTAPPEGGLSLLEAMLKLEDRLVNPILLTTQPATGVLLIFNRGLNYDFFNRRHIWLITGILAYLIATVIALTVMDPSLRKMIALGKAGRAGTPEFGALAGKLDRFGPIMGILAVIIIVMMAWKPGSGCGPLLRC